MNAYLRSFYNLDEIGDHSDPPFYLLCVLRIVFTLPFIVTTIGLRYLLPTLGENLLVVFLDIQGIMDFPGYF